MPRGGKRPGSGRPRGSPNKASAAREARIAAEGVTPLEVLIAMMRRAFADGDRVAAIYARDAAPYVHPRLSAVDHSGEIGHRNLDALTDEQLADIASGRSAGTAPPPGGSPKPH